MMKTMFASRFLAVTMLAGLLTPSPAIARKDDQAEVRMQAAHQKQLLDRNEAAIKARARLVASGQLVGPNSSSTMIALPSVTNSPVRVLKTLIPTGPQNGSQLTVLAGMPDWIWCMLHRCNRG